MKTLLIRTGSIPVQNRFNSAGSPPRLSLSSRTLSLVSLDSSNTYDWPGLQRTISLDSGDWFESGGGNGKGRNFGGGDGWSKGDGSDQRDMGEYYRKMLRLNPGDPLLLANYAKFLYEVEGNTAKAAKYYGRAILANPSDGEVLSLYGKLIWETERDGERAKTYFHRALHASPENSAVLGMYAHFMWEAEENEDNSVDQKMKCSRRLYKRFEK